MLLLVWAISGIYSSSLLKRGWVPHDEGTLGTSAMRVLEGQLPHRDFDDVYTGGLSFINAAAFRLWGENLAAPRRLLFIVFLAWIPVVYWIASRFATPLTAGGTTLLAATCSIPNYSAAIPSWYNLFFATFGLALILCYLDSGHARWLFLAGLCGGISFLFKVSGIYFIAAVLLFSSFREQGLARSTAGPRKRGLYSVFLITALVVFILVLVVAVFRKVSAVGVVEFVVPAAAIAVLVIVRELDGTGTPDRARVVAFARIVLPFLCGAALPIVIFLLPYFVSGSAAAFVKGVFVLPARRFQFATHRPGGFGLKNILGAVALLTLLNAAYRGRGRSWTTRGMVILALVAVFAASKDHRRVLESAWDPLVLLILVAALAGVWVGGVRRDAEGPSFLRLQEIVLLVSVMAVCSLIQVPFAAPIYFFYVAPLVSLALLAVFSTRVQRSRFLLASVLVFYLAFVVFRITPGFIYAMGLRYQADPQIRRLDLARAGGLRVDPEEARQYQQLVAVVEEHAGGSSYIYAAPDCPEVYFLADKRNPTRTQFDFFDEPAGHAERVLNAIETRGVKVVAILTKPPFSPAISTELVTALRERFPQSAEVGRFEVRWRP